MPQYNEGAPSSTVPTREFHTGDTSAVASAMSSASPLSFASPWLSWGPSLSSRISPPVAISKTQKQRNNNQRPAKDLPKTCRTSHLVSPNWRGVGWYLCGDVASWLHATAEQQRSSGAATEQQRSAMKSDYTKESYWAAHDLGAPSSAQMMSMELHRRQSGPGSSFVDAGAPSSGQAAPTELLRRRGG